jgi:hypothetical protein
LLALPNLEGKIMLQAEESRQVAKARRKLKKHLEIIDRQLTQTALKEAVEKMYRWLDKNSETRISLENKNIRRLFDGNNHSAKNSSSIEKQRNNILDQFQKEEQKLRTLEGRVKPHEASQFSIKPPGIF